MQQRQSRSRPRDSEHFHHAPQHHPNPHTNYPPQNPRSLTKEPSLTHKQTQVRPKAQHRVHYADTVDTLNFTEEKEDMSLYEGPTSRRVSPRCPPQPNRNSKERVLLRGLGDRLRREAMLRSQMAVTAATNPGYGLTPPRPYPVSRTVRTRKSTIGRGVEIDVEYGTDDNEEPAECSPGEVVVDQMSSEWWVESAQLEHCALPHRRALKDDPLVNVVEPLCWLSPPSPSVCPSPCRHVDQFLPVFELVLRTYRAQSTNPPIIMSAVDIGNNIRPLENVLTVIQDLIFSHIHKHQCYGSLLTRLTSLNGPNLVSSPSVTAVTDADPLSPCYWCVL